MTNKTELILKEILEKVNPLKQEFENMDNILKKILEKLERRINQLKIKAEIFVGGSFAKKTLIKKDKYDIDVFIRFGSKHKEISKLTEKILNGFKNVMKIHGSRDYFRINLLPNLSIELIPVRKIQNPKNAENITDLSYSHVRYIKNKVKPQKILDDIKIAKAFCHANNCYGAESYVNGFSGYALELLVHHHKGFLNFVKAISKIKDKEVIDIEKQFKNKQTVLMDLNSSKLISPIILIDPTYKQRNALAALSDETLKKFQKVCKAFLKKPNIKFFEIQKTDIEQIKNSARKNNLEFILIELKTNKQEGDVAGTKLLKFYNFLNLEIEKFFKINKKGFNYNGKKSARYFFVVKRKGEIIFQGPSIKDMVNVQKFKKKHKNIFKKSKNIFAKEKINFSVKDFISKWKIKNKKTLEEMSILDLKIVS